MATYYWRGGVGTWNGSNTANWSTTSGGSGGAGPPTSTDDVIFDNASDAAGNFTVTCTTASAVCQDFTCTGPDVIITFSGGFSCHGNFSAANTANNVYTSCDVTLRATTTGKTFTSNARTIRSVTCNGAGGEWTMQDALTMGTLSGFTLTAGTWKTNNFNMTNGTWNISGTSTREIQLGSSTISIQGSTTATLNASTITNLTFTAGTSTINFPNGTSTLDSAGLTFYNVG